MTPPRPQTLPTILLILHTPNGSPGYVGQAFKNHGFALKEVRTCHEPLPHDLSRYAGVVSFGGPMSANDESLELIRNELRWLPQVLRAQLPFLGICLGAQMMARVLGAQVSRHPECLLEAGYYPIEPTPEGRSTFGGPMAVYHWHQEGFTLPRSAVLLARGQNFPHQAYRYGDRVHGVQFHPEMDSTTLERWLGAASHKLNRPIAQDSALHRLLHQRHKATVRRWLHSFVDTWRPPQP